MSNIFKFYINNANQFNRLYIFIKNKYLTSQSSLVSVKELNTNYSDSSVFLKSSVYEKYFNNGLDFDENDLMYLNTFGTIITFVDNVINSDDTIETIKLKLIQAINETTSQDQQICFEEIYMYGLAPSILNKLELFINLTNNNKNDLTRNMLINYFKNIYEGYNILNNLEIKEIYSYDSINYINTTNIHEYKSLGQSFIKYYQNFIVNPYNYEKNLTKQTSDIITINNYNMLFEYNVRNTIFVCLASEFFKLTKNIEDDELLIKIYFNSLYLKNIVNVRDFNTKKIELIKKTTELFNNENFKNKNDFLFLLETINVNTSSLKYENSGIIYININIHSTINSNISLETIFKLFTSSELYPFVKYNPGKKLENLYRLYCDKTNNKKKIPMLSKTLILKYAKSLGKAHTITFYINSKEELFINNVNEFIIELEDTGIINVKIDFKNIMSIENINILIANNVNTLIKFIKSLIVNNTIELFDKLTKTNIEINCINYVSNINIKGTPTLKTISNCISFLFNVIKHDPKEIIMRYKHVSNFSLMNSEDAFIIELIKQKFTETEILNKLEENYKLSYDESRAKLISVINSLKLVQNTFNFKKLNIKNNPGFLTTLKKTTSSNLSISIENIDAIDYLKNMSVYIDSIVKILFNQLKDTPLEQNIKTLCKKISAKEEIEEQKIEITDVAENEKIITNVAHLLENDDEDEVSSMNNDLLNILLDDEDEDEDEDEEKKEDDEEDEEPIDKINTGSITTDEKINIEDIEEEVPYVQQNTKEESIKEKITDDPKKEEDDEEGFKEFSDKSNPILKRLINKEPTLFSTDKNKFFTEYSRLCQANIKKQPVILTQEEKDIIDEKDRNNAGIKSYTESFKYGTKEGNTYHYICPRYWDLEKNISLSHNEVLSKKYGKVITKKNKDGTYDGNIMEFTDQKHHLDEKGNYITHVPGFLDEKHNRNGFCLPCCFNNKLWNKPQQQQRRSKCLNSDYKMNDEQKKDNFNYVKGPEKFPLEKNKLGFLPISIQKLLQFDNLDCVTKQTPNLLKTNHKCLLRYGVENSSNQSFIGCIADLYESLIIKNKKSISINEMKNIIANSISIDTFIKYNNGNLPHIFISRNFNEVVDTIIIDNYESSKLYQEVIKSSSKPDTNYENIDKLILFKKIINSFENFLRYLESNLIIDYTYLWDIICKRNPLLFPDGLNLIILDITTEDITDNIKILCPKQNYSDEFLDIKKKNLLLIKKDDHFEPIYLINNTINNYDFTKVFPFSNNKEDNSLKNFKLILNNIRKAINSNCIHKIDTKKYTSSIYNFKPNIPLDNIINILLKLKYEITYQIIDYNSKVIGITIKKENESGFIEKGFIPCYPSGLSSNYEQISYKLIDEIDDDEYNDYSNTKELLQKIYKLSDYKIICKPEYKVLEEGAVVGILTLGNQFIRLSNPEQNNEDELIQIENKDYVFVDKEIQTKYYKNNNRNETITNIKLETLFYNNFKNTFKKILNININNKKKNELLRIINNNSMLYLDKLSNIYTILKSIGTNYIIFSEDMKPILDNIKLSSCFDDEKCPSIVCKKLNTSCSLIIPKTNLINNEKNEELYYTRLSDEFVRFNKFRNFIFENSNVYSYGSVEYNILSNELLLFQSSLTQEFFRDIPYTNKDNIYIDKFDTFDTFDTLGFENTDKTLNLKTFKKEKGETIVIEVPTTKDKEIIKQNKMFQENPEKFKTIDELKQINADTEDIEDDTYQEDEEVELDKNIKLLTTYTDPNHYCSFNKNVIMEDFRKNFKTTIHQLRYSLDDKICSFQLILIIIKYHNTQQHINLTIEDLKKKLISLYQNNSNFDSLCYILLKNNKKTIIEKVIAKEITIEECILSNEYYVTYIDIYLLSKEYDLPIILLCNTIIDRTITNENFIVFNVNRLDNNYFFIKNRTLYDRKKIHNYKLIINSSLVVFNIDEDLQYSSGDLQSKLQDEINNFKDVLGSYINNYNLSDKKQPTKFKEEKIAEEKIAEEKIAEEKIAEEKVQEEKVQEEIEEEEKVQEEIEEEEKVAEEKSVIASAEETTQTKKSKRCPNGTRKNKKTGLCEKIAEETVAEEKVQEEKVAEEKSVIASAEETTQTKKSKRCPNGTRKNKKTGLCEKI